MSSWKPNAELSQDLETLLASAQLNGVLLSGHVPERCWVEETTKASGQGDFVQRIEPFSFPPSLSEGKVIRRPCVSADETAAVHIKRQMTYSFRTNIYVRAATKWKEQEQNANALYSFPRTGRAHGDENCLIRVWPRALVIFPLVRKVVRKVTRVVV